jgi:selenocysteine lyase/cysteine desulfurase
MPVVDHWAYFDHAAVAPISRPAHEAIARWSAESVENGGMIWAEWAARLGQIRQRAAKMVAAAPEEIAFVRNTTDGIGLVAEGFPWQSGDNVVTLANEFPSNQYPWLNLADRGVEVRRVPVDGPGIDVEQIAAACDQRTRIVAVSWVGYATGWRLNPAELADAVHRRGALLFLDAIQGLGVFPLDAAKSGVDFFAADGHKWMLGPEGAGLLYIRREHLDRLHAIGVGWNSVAHRDFNHIELNLKDTAERYEGGSPNMPGLIGLGASLDLLCDLGMENVSRQVIAAGDAACERLQAIGAEIKSDRRSDRASGIISFVFPGADAEQMRKYCHDRNVALSCRAGRLRISPHGYNDGGDIDRLVETLQAARGA